MGSHCGTLQWYGGSWAGLPLLARRSTVVKSALKSRLEDSRRHHTVQYYTANHFIDTPELLKAAGLIAANDLVVHPWYLS